MYLFRAVDSQGSCCVFALLSSCPQEKRITLRPMCQTRATRGAAGVPISSSSIPDLRFCRRRGCTSVEWRKDEPSLRRDS
jgi:hypothetical protein